MPTYPFKITSTYGTAVNVYSTMSNAPTNPPTADPAAYAQIYTSLGSVAAGGSGGFSTSVPLARIVITRQGDELPILVSVVSAMDPGSSTISLSNNDETIAESGWRFYQAFVSQPYSPASLAFASLVEAADPSTLTSQVATFFNNEGYPGVTLGLFTAFGYWATNQLYAFPGTYWCYEPPTGSSLGFILPTTSVGTITIANGTASFAPTGGNITALTFSNSQLTSAGAAPAIGVQLTGIIRDLAWEGTPDVITWGFVGTNNGAQFIAQSYQNPTVPWYAVVYDLTYGAFFAVQLCMAVDAAIHLLSATGTGLQWLAENIGTMAGKVRDFANATGDSAGSGSAVGESADAINVDVDVDVDVDIDVDIDIDIDVDIDIDIDVDIDVDVDVDFVAVVDVDVDVDINIDVDVVTDVDIDVDIDVDVDVDVDTDVNVEPGMIGTLLSKVGNWIMTRALPTLIEGAVISVAFQSVGELLNAWKSADEQSMKNLQPRQTTGLGLLVNYMFNQQIGVTARWNTFSQYVQESSADTGTLQLNMSTILQTRNTVADNESAAWRWSTSDETAAVSAMKAYTGADTYKAFQTLASYTYKGKALPVKTSAAVALKYLSA